MNRKRIYLVLSLVITILAAGIIEFYILLSESYGQGIIQSPTVLGEVIIITIKVIPIIAVLYNLFMLIFEESISDKIILYLTSIAVAISLPYSLFLALFLYERLKSSQNKLDYKFGILVFVLVFLVGFASSITTSQSPLITNYRPTKYTIDYSFQVEDGIEFGDFYLGIHFFNENYSYSTSDFEFELINTDDIDYGSIEYNKIEYDILVEDLYICKDKISNSISFDDHCGGIPQVGGFFYGESELSFTIKVRLYNDSLLVIESEYTFNNVNEYFDKGN